MSTKYFRLLASFAIISAVGLVSPTVSFAQSQLDATQASVVAPPGEIQESTLTARSENGNSIIHALPSVQFRNSLPQSDSGPLLYHSGGSIMQPSVTIYPVFWTPSHLQNGAGSGLSSHYESVQANMLADYIGHGIGNINTQYFQTISGHTTYIQNKGGFGSAFVDTGAYPSSGCRDGVTGTNCMNDLQIQAEVVKVINFAHLSGGLNKIIMIFTGTGEGSCFKSDGKSCAYTNFCAYHSHLVHNGQTYAYSNQPYGDPRFCQIGGAPSPNNDLAADTAATAASHELSEAITDPLGNAWFTSQGNENGDLCAFKYGPLTWFGVANQMWNGHFYLLQTEFDNHDRGCFEVGPA